MAKITMFQTTSRILQGIGAIGRVSAEVARLHVKRVAVITDPGIVKAGLADRLTSILTAANIEYAVFDEVEPDPSIATALKAVDFVRANKAGAIIGMGGGSAIDIGKVASVLSNSSQGVGELIGIDQVHKRGVPVIVIPTTAGTGSEVTPIAILSDHEEKLKKGIVSPYLFPATAILDPELTVGLPPQVTAASGMDALIHAVEAFTSVNATPFTDMFAVRAMQLVSANIVAAYKNGENMEARSAMLEGSMLAGIAFANAGVTAVHAFAYPIGAEFHIPHGVANSIMLVPVMDFNMHGNPARFKMLAEHLGAEVAGMDDIKAAEKGIAVLRRLAEELELPDQLSPFGVTEKDLPALAAGVMKVTRLLANNPRELTEEDAREIYASVL